MGTQAKPCIFPFLYAGTEYSACTARDSDTGQAWCATQVRRSHIIRTLTSHHDQVDSEGWVVDHAWGDCDTGCPGTRESKDTEYPTHDSLLTPV